MGHGQRRGWKGAARTAQAFFVRQLGAQGSQQRDAHQERPGGRQKGRERSGGTRCRVRIRQGGEEERAVISLSSMQQAKVTSQAKVKSQTHLQAESAQQSSRKEEREKERESDNGDTKPARRRFFLHPFSLFHARSSSRGAQSIRGVALGVPTRVSPARAPHGRC